MMHFGNRSLLALMPAAMLATELVSAPAQAQDGVIRIGITLRMIVENGLKYGQMSKDELEAVNASGGINGKKIEVVLLDDECKPDKGIANVNRFIHQHKVHLVMGSTCSSVTMPMVDVHGQGRGAADRAALHQRQHHQEGQRLGIPDLGVRAVLCLRARQVSVRERRQEGRLPLHDGRRRHRLRQGLHVLHGEDVPGEAAVRGADAGRISISARTC